MYVLRLTMVIHKCPTQWEAVANVPIPLPDSFDLGQRSDNITVVWQTVGLWMRETPSKTLTQLGALCHLRREFGLKYG